MECHEGKQPLMAYPPLPRDFIKEELEIGEGSDEFIAKGEQVIILSLVCSRLVLFRPCML